MAWNRNRVIGTIVVSLILAAIIFFLWGRSSHKSPSPQVERGKGSTLFSYENYAHVLRTYIDDRGMVDYKNLQQGRDKKRIAFWINSYNALTLEAILNHYPIRPSVLKSLVYPQNSIRQIPGVWDELQFSVVGRAVTLNQIEHEFLRKEFNEPRIHFALVCASKG